MLFGKNARVNITTPSAAVTTARRYDLTSAAEALPVHLPRCDAILVRFQIPRLGHPLLPCFKERLKGLVW